MLYQLSYASPNHPETAPETETCAGTLPLRAYHGTVSKISTAGRAEQTGGRGDFARKRCREMLSKRALAVHQNLPMRPWYGQELIAERLGIPYLPKSRLQSMILG